MKSPSAWTANSFKEFGGTLRLEGSDEHYEDCLDWRRTVKIEEGLFRLKKKGLGVL